VLLLQLKLFFIYVSTETAGLLGTIFTLSKQRFFMRNKKETERKGVNAIQKNEPGRVPAFETPSQRRNRDGQGRGKNGSDGGSTRGRGSNH
jgi:hypothetical protein